MQGDSRVAHFEYHKLPITSIEWSPHEPSTLAVSSADNQLTIWDLSLEKDEEEEAEFKAQTKEKVDVPEDLPPQLLFVHQGQKDLKELHWHGQIPGMLMSTAADGFNILMPSNIENTLPSENSCQLCPFDTVGKGIGVKVRVRVKDEMENNWEVTIEERKKKLAQILVFVLLKLPYKLVMKSKRVIVKVKLSCKSRKRRDETRWRLEDQQRSDGQNIAGHGRDTARIIVEQKWVHDLSRYHECRSLVLMEVEKMLEELYLKGEFAFGSFWGRDQTGNFSHDHDIAQQEFDDVVQNQLIGIIKALRNHTIYITYEIMEIHHPPFPLEEGKEAARDDDKLTCLMNSLKKLESELEKTKLDVKLLKEREQEMRMTMASITAALKNNIYGMAAKDGEQEERGSSFDERDDSSGEDDICEEKQQDTSSPSLWLEHSSSTAAHRDEEKRNKGDLCREKQQVQMRKVKPIIPLLGDIFSRKKNSSSSPDSIHNLLYTSHNMYFD
ncbi:hypothetical protein Sjap_017892 [Stephania japonica]|uniref:Uncharacterized protein n=1 Tax=Stephania japonica TaxID=461633 RepID=A0AAP0I700_9MAGN